MTNEIPPKHE